MKAILPSAMRRELQALVARPVAWEGPLAAHTSLHIGGPAEALVTVEGCLEIAAVLGFASRLAIPWRVLGKGSNVLASDDGLPGMTLMLGEASRRLEKIGDREVAAGAAGALPALSYFCQENGLSGLEFAAGIPGSIGGAVVMNAGAFSGQISTFLSAIELCDQDGPHTLPATELRFAYRACLDAETWRGQAIITGVRFVLRRDDPAAIAARMEEYQRARRQGQPHGLASAGSFFKNPPGDSAGRLIDACGLKGLRVGDAMVSPAHANFFVNTGQASAADMRELARLVREAVYRRHGVQLEQEVEAW